MNACGPARQVRFTNKAFWRNPASAFFTFAFPLMFLVIFTALLGSGTRRSRGGSIVQDVDVLRGRDGRVRDDHRVLHEHRDSIMFPRDAGVLKRIRGTPLPGGTYLRRG